MFIDTRSQPGNTTFEADLAIIGGGAAGITLARSFAGSSVSVCIVEAGGREHDAENQSLYEGENTGIPYNTRATRLRHFGGSTNHWGGYCRPLDPIDFEMREWVPNSGWPFSRDELLPYYGPAGKLVELGSDQFDQVDFWSEATGEALPELATGRLRRQFVQFSPPTRFGTRYEQDLRDGGNIRVLLHANVVNIAAGSEGKIVEQLDIRTLNGLRHKVKARYFVLATGGLENARMLLLSNQQVSAGLGNQNDLVGRFFMEHPHLAGFGEIVLSDPARMPLIYRERFKFNERTTKVAFNPSDAFLRKERLLNATFMMGIAGEYTNQGTPHEAGSREESHVRMLGAAQNFLRDTVPPSGSAPGSLGVWLGIGGSCEQVPNPNSRVLLSVEKDRFDLPKIHLDWRLTDQDRHSFHEHVKSLALEFSAMGMGRMRLNAEDDSEWPLPINGGSHHMGTTRMHYDPKKGVVDANCKVHTVENLYIAGSSVFTTSGVSNPTLTLVALTLRLADHLKRKFR